MSNNKKSKNEKYFDMEPEIQYLDNILKFKTSEKGDHINLILRDKIENKSGLPHKKSILELLNRTNNKILEEFYEISKETDKKGYIHLGNLENLDRVKRTVVPYSYLPKNNLFSRGIKLPISFPSNGKSPINVKTTNVASGAVLQCDKGSGELMLNVTSQLKTLIWGHYIATEDDNVAKINIVPVGMSCGQGRDSNCGGKIAIGSGWEGLSTGVFHTGKKALLNTSYCSCIHGGKITIKDPNSKLHTN